MVAFSPWGMMEHCTSDNFGPNFWKSAWKDHGFTVERIRSIQNCFALQTSSTYPTAAIIKIDFHPVLSSCLYMQ